MRTSRALAVATLAAGAILALGSPAAADDVAPAPTCPGNGYGRSSCTPSTGPSTSGGYGSPSPSPSSGSASPSPSASTSPSGGASPSASTPVTSASPSTPTLPVTGGSIGLLAGVAAVLLAAGAGIWLLARRRRA